MTPDTKTASLSLKDVLLATLSGLLMTASFPPGHLFFVAWFALVPLLKGLENTSPSSSFRLGLIAGLAHYLTLIYWIIVVLGRYGNLNIIFSTTALLLLSLYLALYLALFSSLISYSKNSRFSLFFMAAFWVALEYVRTKLLTGFPWCLLGYTQYKQSYLIQIADIFGVYGLSFLIVLVNGLIFHLLFRRMGRYSAFLKWEILVVVLIFAGTLGYGYSRFSELGMDKGTEYHVNAVIVQPNIDQSIKWDPAYQMHTITTYQRLTRSAYGFRPQLIVWPETSLPFFFQDNPEFSAGMVSLARESNAAFIFGSPAYRRIRGITRYYNRAYYISSDGASTEHYDKIHLVPFGEYIPLKKFFPFINRLVPAAGDFAAGKRLAPLCNNGLSLGLLICFEAIFPELSRNLTVQGANILINLTNDAWFGMTSAPYQHLSMAVFRSVENKRPMIRAANTGFSAFIGPNGRILASGDLFTQEVLERSITVSDRPLTLYSRFGDIFALTLFVISLLKVISCLFTKWRFR